MLVLSLDTTSKAASCALARDGIVLREEGGDPSQSHASRLPGDLIALLEGVGMTIPAIDLFAVATGPGSFTGLRIGIATMQGLAFAAGKPLIGISGFEALERSFRLKAEATGITQAAGTTNGTGTLAEATGITQATGTADATGPGVRVAVWVDAWRGEVYAALYEDGVEVEPPVVAHPELLLRGLAGRATTFVGDGVESRRELIAQTMGEQARFADPLAPPLAGVIARMATDAAGILTARGDSLPLPHAIRPLYVRRPDVELARDRAV